MKKLKKMWQNACNRMYICPLRCHIFLRYRLIGYYPMERKRIVYKKCKCLCNSFRRNHFGAQRIMT